MCNLIDQYLQSNFSRPQMTDFQCQFVHYWNSRDFFLCRKNGLAAVIILWPARGAQWTENSEKKCKLHGTFVDYIQTNIYKLKLFKNFWNVVHCEVRLTVEVTLFFDLSSLVNVHSRGQKIVFSHEIDIIAECKTQVKNTKIFEKLGLMAEQWCWPSRPPWHGLATILSLHAFLKLLSWWCGRPRICKNHWGHKKVCQHTVSAAATRQK